RASLSQLILRQRSEILFVVLAGESLRTINELYSRRQQPNGQFAVLIAIEGEAFIEEARFEEDLPRNGEVTGVEVSNPYLLARPREYFEMSIELLSDEKDDRSRVRSDFDRNGPKNPKPRAGTMRASVCSQKMGRWLHVVVEQNNELSTSRADPRVASGGTAALGPPDPLQRVRRREPCYNLSRSIFTSIDRHNHFIVASGQCLEA